VAFVLLFMLGIQAFISIPRSYDPGFTIRVAQVITYFPGASPDRVEMLVTEPLEKVLQEIPEVDFISSESRTGISIIKVNVKDEFSDMRPIWDNLRRKVEAVTNDLPDGVLTPEVNDEIGDVFGIVLALTGEGVNYRTLEDYAEILQDKLLRNEQVSKVKLYGTQQEKIYIEYNNSRLSALNLSPLLLSDLLKKQNIVSSGGSILLGKERLELEPSGDFSTIGDIKQIRLILPGAEQVIYLKDIAHIYRGYQQPIKSMVSSFGKDGISLAISMKDGGNNLELGKQVLTELQEFRDQAPYGIDVDVINFEPTEVKKKVNEFTSSLIQAIAVVAGVMIITLGLRTGLIVSLLIPSSMLITILLMKQLGVGLDQISLAALIIALGMLVDNGIVMSESILVQMEKGVSAKSAAINSASELRVPLLISSLTTAAAFLPIYLAESTMGEYTGSLFIVVTLTLLSSWVLSITVIPLLCTLLLKVKSKANKETQSPTSLYQYYELILRQFLSHRIKFLTVVVILFIGSILLLKLVPNIFFPPSERAYFKVDLELPIGSDISQTQALVSDVETLLKKHQVDGGKDSGIVNWVAYIGTGGPRYILPHNPKTNAAEYAFMIVNTKSSELNAGLMTMIETYIFNHHPDVTVTAKLIENGQGITNPVEIRVTGSQKETLFNITNSIKEKMAGIKGIRNIKDNWGNEIKKLKVNIDQDKASLAGITNQDIAISLQASLSGMELSEYREEKNTIPIILRAEQSDRDQLNKVRTIAVFSQATGKSMPLSQIATIDIEWQSAKIFRRNRIKTVTLGAQLVGDETAQEVINQLTVWLEKEKRNWPIGYYFEVGGEVEKSKRSTATVSEKVPIGIMCILLLLVVQFNSVRKPLIILSTIPLAFTGVSLGLVFANTYLGFMTFLGVISLAGIVINNAIVLLEKIKDELWSTPESPIEAIITASQSRLRPILITTVTTICGLIPLYIGGGLMWESMAVAIMAGLMFSTILTLAIVPVLYSLLFGIPLQDKWVSKPLKSAEIHKV